MLVFNPLADPCLSCGLWREKKNPCIRPKDYRKGELVFIGEAPGENEDNAGNPFVGRAGEILRSILDRLGIGYYTLLNAVACRPTNRAGDNRAPTTKEIGLCGSFLFEDIRLLEPSKLICLGRVAAKAVGFPTDTWLGELRHRKWCCQVGYTTATVEPWKAPRDDDPSWMPIPLWVTYHPAAGLRPGKANLIKELENDLKEYLANDVSNASMPPYPETAMDSRGAVYFSVAENKAVEDRRLVLTSEEKCGILTPVLNENWNGSGPQMWHRSTGQPCRCIAEFFGPGHDEDLIPAPNEETIKEAIDSMNEVVIDIETSGFFKDHDAFPFDNKGTILNIGTDKGQVEGDLGEPWADWS